MNYHTIESTIGEIRDIDNLEVTRVTDGLLERRTVDFVIGDRDMYPGLGDDLPRMIASSSVVLTENEEGHAICRDANVHLPPYRKLQQDRLEAELDLPPFFEIRYGTTGPMGTTLPAPTWGLAPHIYITEKVTAQNTLTAIRRAARAVEYVEPMTMDELREEYSG